jgi:hypothetical protein
MCRCGVGLNPLTDVQGRESIAPETCTVTSQ